jgi:hypothetical protein
MDFALNTSAARTDAMHVAVTLPCASTAGRPGLRTKGDALAGRCPH